MVENWFRYEQPIEGSSGNIFLFPHAGSSASFFASWKKGTNHKCGFFPVQYPGRENRRKDTISPSIKELAEAFVKDESELLTKKPFVLFGQCMGALICWEIALELQRKGMKMPCAVVVSSSASPTERAIEKADDMSRDEIVDYLCRMGFIDRSITEEKEFFEYYLSLMKIDMMWLKIYDYEGQREKKINCSIYSFNGRDDDKKLLNQSLEWGKFTQNNFTQKLFCGGHFYLSDDPNEVVTSLEEIILKSEKQ